MGREQRSGTTLESHPKLKTILDFIHPGETLVVICIDRLARSMQDLQVIVARLKERGAHLAVTGQPVDTSTAAGKTFFDMLGVFAEFETNLRRERQVEGIKVAVRKWVYRGHPPKIDIVAIQARLDAGISPTEVTREMGGSRGTVYKAKAQMATGTDATEEHDHEKERSQAKTSCAQTARAGKSQDVATAQSDT